MLIGSRALPLALVALIVAPSFAACADDTGRTDDGLVRVEASFYPLAWMAERVGGTHVSVASLTKAGAEPHDLELTPSDVARVLDADVIVYLEGFQPTVDAAVEGADPTARFDAAQTAQLDLPSAPADDHQETEDEDHAHDDHGDDLVDRHFWLDPTRLATVADAFAERLATVDPANAPDYRDNAAALVDELDALDGRFAAGLAACATRNLVTTHSAFGYLARRYDLAQLGITGPTPEQEPSPTDLAAVTDYVEEHGVGTIFFETLVGPDLADVVARETGVRTAVLDPIEGLTDASEGRDYIEVMEANLRNLREGLGCD